jgi:hypothetical protein
MRSWSPELYLNRLRPPRAIRFEQNLVARVGAGGLNRPTEGSKKGKKWQKGQMAFFALLPLFAFFASHSEPKNRLSEWLAIKALQKPWLRDWRCLTVLQSVC